MVLVWRGAGSVFGEVRSGSGCLNFGVGIVGLRLWCLGWWLRFCDQGGNLGREPARLDPLNSCQEPRAEVRRGRWLSTAAQGEETRS